jgi:hypothetical protein
MELLGDMGHVEPYFGPFGDTIRSVQDRSMVCAKRTQKSFWTQLMVLLGDDAQVQTRFGPFGDSPNLDTR